MLWPITAVRTLIFEGYKSASMVVKWLLNLTQEAGGECDARPIRTPGDTSTAKCLGTGVLGSGGVGCRMSGFQTVS